MTRLRLDLTGAVQGVGFRPFVHRLAGEMGLAGWVRNSSGGVAIEVEGAPEKVERFTRRLQRETPPHASIRTLARSGRPPENTAGFRIAVSAPGASGAEILPDLATCPDCLAELFDPRDRRFAYPFINCTHCGPRFSIVVSLPYDRDRTTMLDFSLCQTCREEYETPENRRFHAQPNACPDCGPQLEWLDGTGKRESRRESALERAATALENGEVVAVKGIGGFHLFADARDPEAIRKLRQRKHRPEKPFALMMPSLARAREALEISDAEADWLTSAAAPIVILRRRAGSGLPESLAPGNPGLGVMLPYCPLHHLLLKRLGFPVVATSGNRGDEPICIDNKEAVSRLRGIADGFLVHDRPIARAVDDSVMRFAAGREMLLRRSRGFAPAPIPVPEVTRPVLAYGGDLKGTIAVGNRGQVRLSQHLGDLASAESREALVRHLEDFPRLCGATPETIACDRHPAYHSHQLAKLRSPGGVVTTIQHHHAHAVACAAENGIGPEETFLAVAWDGTGYGEDGTIWGGEFLVCRGAGFRRFAWLRPFALPGGEKAVRDPRFAALGCLHAAGIADTLLAESMSSEERRIGRSLIEKGVNAPLTSSMGRWFDAVSALCGLCQENAFEGQAAMALEFAASTDPDLPAYPAVPVHGDQPIDWTPLTRSLVADLTGPTPDVARISRRFHQTLADLAMNVARQAGCPLVALTGGCFQNALLLELSIARLREAGFNPVWHRQVPPNDGGLALGQAVIASRTLNHATSS